MKHRRLAAALAAAAALGGTALAVPGTAHAAGTAHVHVHTTNTGQVIIDGNVYQDPRGCVNIDPPADESQIFNNTDNFIGLYDGPDCTGNVVGGLDSGEQGQVTAQSFSAY